ncbi:hypothetical protein ACTHQ0_28330, partial [Priestia megaterium]|uniref:hypothetical protein n=1 Tax=Priestia megaterium TaxID=1404 RepID=UPI003F7D83F9
VTSTIPAAGCLKGALIPVSQTGCSPPYSQRVLFLVCVPERDIMLTNVVYDIQLKKRKDII